MASSPSPKATSPKGLTQGERLDVDYELPFLAHATLEPHELPRSRLTPGACEVWTGTQVMSRAQSNAAKAAGLPVEKVTVNNHLHRRRLRPQARAGHGGRARCASPSRSTTPVKVVWTREEDMQHDVYRPVYRDTISAVPVERQDRRLEIQGHGLVDLRALAAARVPEGH